MHSENMIVIKKFSLTEVWPKYILKITHVSIFLVFCQIYINTYAFSKHNKMTRIHNFEVLSTIRLFKTCISVFDSHKSTNWIYFTFENLFHHFILAFYLSISFLYILTV